MIEQRLRHALHTAAESTDVTPTPFTQRRPHPRVPRPLLAAAVVLVIAGLIAGIAAFDDDPNVLTDDTGEIGEIGPILGPLPFLGLRPGPKEVVAIQVTRSVDERGAAAWGMAVDLDHRTGAVISVGTNGQYAADLWDRAVRDGVEVEVMGTTGWFVRRSVRTLEVGSIDSELIWHPSPGLVGIISFSYEVRVSDVQAIADQLVELEPEEWLATIPRHEGLLLPREVDARLRQLSVDTPLPDGTSLHELLEDGDSMVTGLEGYFMLSVANQVACAWGAEWLAATETGDEVRAAAAQQALEDAPNWLVNSSESGGANGAAQRLLDAIRVGQVDVVRSAVEGLPQENGRDDQTCLSDIPYFDLII